MATRLTKLDAGLLNAAEDIRSEFLACRKSLPSADNNQSPPPRNAYSAYIHNEMLSGRSMAVTHLLALTKSNLEDGMSYAEATRWLRRMERHVEEWSLQVQSRGHGAAHGHGSALRFPERPVTIPVKRETRAEGAFNMIEIPLVTNDKDPEVLRQAIRAAQMQEEATADIRLWCERRLVSLVGSAS